MLNKNGIVFLIVALIAIVILDLYACQKGEKAEEKKAKKITNFEECISAGHPVMESYPRQCKTPDGKTFVEDIGNEVEKADLIRVNNPRPNQTIKSPLTIEGEARGFWFFEASFPIKLLDEKGNELGIAIAQAQDEWMTEDFVPFRAQLEFSPPETDRGTLVLEKDNPSGLPEHDDELRIPVRFEETSAGHAPDREMMKVKVYFIDKEKVEENPQFQCSDVFPVEREIPKTKSVARATLVDVSNLISSIEPLLPDRTKISYSNSSLIPRFSPSTIHICTRV
jgi:Immunoglobulin-like domain of bacterial spore germination.